MRDVADKTVESYLQLFEDTLSFGGLSWWLIDLVDDPNVFYCNAEMRRTFGLDDSVVRHSVSQTCPIAGDYNKYVALGSSSIAQQIFDDYNKLRHGEIAEYSNHFPYYSQDSDETQYFSSRAKALSKSPDGKAEILFGIIEPETVSSELFTLAKTDGLTGLNNRREFDSQLDFLLDLNRRNNATVSLVLCDIDHFKKYNDSAGHYAGDECLTQIAQIIAGVCNRSTEIVCRYGGEEFAIIIYGDDKQASHIANAILQEVRNHAIPHPGLDNEPVTVSVGYASVRAQQRTTPKDLIEMADKALYQAKQQGRNTCIAFQHPEFVLQQCG